MHDVSIHDRAEALELDDEVLLGCVGRKVADEDGLAICGRARGNESFGDRRAVTRLVEDWFNACSKLNAKLRGVTEEALSKILVQGDAWPG